ncbi:MAG: hypothetical protein PHS37_02275 [Candidatus Omnitrophica bacterium]|nr:hypothetical protein [Candidatus Omnitrophota bacterium]
MNKKEITNELESFIKIEERAMVLYARHQDQPSFLASFKEADQHRIKAILATMLDDSRRHKETFKSLLKRAQEDAPQIHDDGL